MLQQVPQMVMVAEEEMALAQTGGMVIKHGKPIIDALPTQSKLEAYFDNKLCPDAVLNGMVTLTCRHSGF
jgi:hypothetical protein